MQHCVGSESFSICYKTYSGRSRLLANSLASSVITTNLHSVVLRCSNQECVKYTAIASPRVTMFKPRVRRLQNVLHFSATVTNLQTKVEQLTTTNALMKEDLAIAKNSLLTLYDENRQLRKELGREAGDPVQITNMQEEDGSGKSVDVAELKQRLEEERKLRQEAEKELDLQVSLFCLLNLYN